MINASLSSRQAVRSQPVVSGGGVPYVHLHVVNDDVYSDWETVYRDNVDRLYRLMYARVGNRPDAEDLTSEVFSTALRPMRLPSSKGEAQSYLLITAKTVLASHWRRRLGQPCDLRCDQALARRLVMAISPEWAAQLRLLEDVHGPRDDQADRHQRDE